MENSKKKMFKIDQGKICTLPDAVLHHILSFMDMKEVVATSLLSTRWRYLWVSLTTLNFSDSVWIVKLKNGKFKPRPKRFMNFVDKVLLLHDISDISKFRITCSTQCDSKRVYEWLTVAARRQFQEIHLELLLQEQIKLPHLLYSSSITVLKIDAEGSMSNDLIQIPSMVCFSHILKTLLLCWVMLPEGNSDGELVFSNPVLENLILSNCALGHLSALNISAYRLKNLVFETECYDSMECCSIKICTPKLISIDLGGFWYVNCCLENISSISSLVRAKFNLCNPEALDLVKVLECVSCPTTIEISGALNDDEELPGKVAQSYTHVRSLKFCKWDSIRYGIRPPSNSFLLKLLNICPFLETLCLEKFEIDDQEEQCPFPITFHHLKYVEIEKVSLCRDGLKFLKFLLKNAIILEKLVIKMNAFTASDLIARILYQTFTLNWIGKTSIGLQLIVWRNKLCSRLLMY